VRSAELSGTDSDDSEGGKRGKERLKPAQSWEIYTLDGVGIEADNKREAKAEMIRLTATLRMVTRERGESMFPKMQPDFEDLHYLPRLLQTKDRAVSVNHCPHSPCRDAQRPPVQVLKVRLHLREHRLPPLPRHHPQSRRQTNHLRLRLPFVVRLYPHPIQRVYLPL
jgi:hypothetical protein